MFAVPDQHMYVLVSICIQDRVANPVVHIIACPFWQFCHEKSMQKQYVHVYILINIVHEDIHVDVRHGRRSINPNPNPT